jgi:hypothetical protein
MTDSHLIIPVLEQGAVVVLVWIGIAFLLSRFFKDIVGRSVLAIFLFIAAGIYLIEAAFNLIDKRVFGWTM